MSPIVRVGDDEIPTIEAVFAPVRHQLTGIKFASFVGMCEQVAWTSTVNAIDHGFYLHVQQASAQFATAVDWVHHRPISLGAMRVVAGSAKGRKLVAPPGNTVRPTGSRVREAMFNAMHSLGAIDDACVLDLFAGSGALGIEALSRGAAHATFVEPDAAARAHITQNLATCAMADQATIVPVTAQRFLHATDQRFDLVLCDPPYVFDEWQELFGALQARVHPDGLVVVESDDAVAADLAWEILRQRRYGGTVVTVMIPTADQVFPSGRPT